MAMKFVRYPSFPQAKCFFTSRGFMWKMEVREWAFAQVNLEEAGPGIDVNSNNPNVVLGISDKTEKGIKSTRSGTTLKVELFAKAPGFTFVHPFRANPFIAEGGLLLQVEVLMRNAHGPKEMSRTKLEGSTFAINAHDAAMYQMDRTMTFSPSATSVAPLFAGVPSGTNHIALSSHGGVPTEADETNFEKLGLYVCGFKAYLRLDMSNVESVFRVLKGKVAENCVIWFGGCNIGANDKFCALAADASGCVVVAPVMRLPLIKAPIGTIDCLDRYAIPKIFVPGGKTISVPDFCAKQKLHKFVVPV